MPSGKSVFDQEFDEVVKAELQKWKVPGLSIALVQSSQINAKVSMTISLGQQVLTKDRHMGLQHWRKIPRAKSHAK